MSVGDPQSFNCYSYVGNDPVDRVDPSGLYYLLDYTSSGIGGFHYGPGGVYGGYLGDLNILIVRRPGNGDGGNLEISGDAAYFLDDVSDYIRDYPLRLLKTRHAFVDADTVLLLDKSCQSFFTKGRSLEEVQKILSTLGKAVVYDADREARAVTSNSGQGANAKITLTPFFFSNDSSRVGYYFNPTEKRYEHREYGLTPRQFRALTILHELAHALGLIPKDRLSVDRTGTQSDQNDDTINEKCGIGLGNLPTND
jgi:hypothetical protein